MTSTMNGVNVSVGLSADEAARQLSLHGPNELPHDRGKGILRLSWEVMREPMLLLLLAAGIINFLLAEPLDGSILLASILLVIGISLYQSRKAETALAALRDLSAPRALVVRDGEHVRIPGVAVVRGDVLILAEGDRVPADAVLIEAVNVTVDESLLTGESVPVDKVANEAMGDIEVAQPGGDNTPWVFSGSLVVRGHGVAVVRRTGVATAIGQIGAALRDITTQRTPLQREIDRLVRVLAVVGVGAAAVVVVVFGLTKGGWLEGLLAGIATVMSMLPEEFPVVFTVFLALGAWKMSRRNVLARRSAVIEALGSATVIGVDKTGTLTMNRMSIVGFALDGHAVTTHDADPRLNEIARIGRLASPVKPFDPMDAAFVAEAHRRKCDDVDPTQLVHEYPLTKSLLAITHVWRGDDSSLVVAAKGAPEAIADLCRLDTSRRNDVMQQVQHAAEEGKRVLGVARARWHDRDPLPDDPHEFAFDFVGLVLLQDPVRPSSAQAVATCARAGVRIVMITGDHPGTALAIAHEVGIDTAGGCITGSEFQALLPDELAQRVRSVSVFARMVPEQKLQLIRALKVNGDVVGMTGDGVNDAPALRAADIGIAMGLRGTDVARESAALVLTDDDIASIAEGVRQGRGIFDNLRKAMAYIIAVHVSIFGMVLLPLFVPDWPLVLLPIQLALLELVIDPACSVVFEAEEHDPQLMDRPPRQIGAPIFGRLTLAVAALQGAGLLIAVAAVYLWSIAAGDTDTRTRSLTFTALVFGNLLLIIVNRSWRLSAVRTFVERRNPMLKWIVGITLIVTFLMLYVPALRYAFGFGPVGWGELAAVAAVSMLGVAWFEVLKACGRRGWVSLTSA